MSALLFECLPVLTALWGFPPLMGFFFGVRPLSSLSSSSSSLSSVFPPSLLSSSSPLPSSLDLLPLPLLPLLPLSFSLASLASLSSLASLGAAFFSGVLRKLCSRGPFFFAGTSSLSSLSSFSSLSSLSSLSSSLLVSRFTALPPTCPFLRAC
eukprot:Tamp_26409.p3 GENE.Tamp_26409~~Tamp_26409.p3  ORF type:complete len:153 (-),score=25.09 Tamp_26409:201-659(-)